MSSCYSPFMFEGCKDGSNSVKIWEVGTILNAFFIGCLPQMVLLAFDYHRGVHNWDFISTVLESELIFENNDALYKNNYGNFMFAIISGILFFFLISFSFLTDKIFSNHGIYCKCCYVLCFPCPQNCFDLVAKYPSQRLSKDMAQNKENVDNEISLINQNCGTEVLIYTKCSSMRKEEDQSSEENIPLKNVRNATFITSSRGI